jgi:hypothetical protein
MQLTIIPESSHLATSTYFPASDRQKIHSFFILEWSCANLDYAPYSNSNYNANQEGR